MYGEPTADQTYGATAEATGKYAYGAILARADGVGGSIFLGYNTANNDDSCITDPHANLTCSGKITGGGELLTRQRSDVGRHVLTYSAQSASATIEDVGTARMSDGVANVQIGTDFASVTDHGWYYVFPTPLGDTRGLYVSRKTASGFQVRETEHGRDSLEFDYRIVAHPFGADAARLPTAPSMPKLHIIIERIRTHL